MKKILFPLFIFTVISWRQGEYDTDVKPPKPHLDTIPSLVRGNFIDDYGIRYRINDSLWIQYSLIKYHIFKWNLTEQYIIARNDDKNPSEAGLYTRIDYMYFDNMAPWLWGFCLTVYNAVNDSLAEFTARADRLNPRKGCNGFPFSRMKKIDQ